jgi:DNA-binding LacI/PurR family transcriptional regulator
MKIINKCRLAIPNGLRFLCFDEVEFLLSEGHEIDYIEQPVSKIGTKALDLIMDGINGSTAVGTFLFDASFNTV